MTDKIWRADEDSAFREVKPGMRRRILTGDNMMVSLWRIRDGVGPTPYDGHPDNEQFGIILAGELDFRIGGDQRHRLRPGDVYWAPQGFPHGDSHFIGDRRHGEVWIADVFVPPREDYRNG